jgi:hypothetical protein
VAVAVAHGTMYLSRLRPNGACFSAAAAVDPLSVVENNVVVTSVTLFG